MTAISEITVNTLISRRTYYAKKSTSIRISSSRASADTVQRMRDICHERVTYGYRRVWTLLRNEGVHMNPKTVYMIMKDGSLSSEPQIHKK